VCSDDVHAFLRSAFDTTYDEDEDGLATDPSDESDDGNIAGPSTRPQKQRRTNGASSAPSSPSNALDQPSKKEPSTKIKELLRLVTDWLANDRKEKVIVYSQCKPCCRDKAAFMADIET
jgi:hypothetical protein